MIVTRSWTGRQAALLHRTSQGSEVKYKGLSTAIYYDTALKDCKIVRLAAIKGARPSSDAAGPRL